MAPLATPPPPSGLGFARRAVGLRRSLRVPTSVVWCFFHTLGFRGPWEPGVPCGLTCGRGVTAVRVDLPGITRLGTAGLATRSLPGKHLPV